MVHKTINKSQITKYNERKIIMKKTIYLLLIIFLLLISSCSQKPLAVLTDNSIEIDMVKEYDPYSAFTDIQDGVDISYELDETNSKITFTVSKDDKKEVYEGIDVTLIYPQIDEKLLKVPYKVKALEDIEIHDDHTTESNLAGYVRKGDTIEVYEVFQDNTDVWCRVSSKHWINNKEAELLELLSYDTDINIIKNIITFTDESLSMDRLSPWYDRYYQYVPCNIESMCGFGACEMDEKGRVFKWTGNNVEGLSYTPFVEYTFDEKDRRVHVSGINVNGSNCSWDYTYDDYNRIITEVYNDGSANPTYHNEYDSNGNLIRISSDSSNTEVEYEYNGSIRFETIPYDSANEVFHIYRFDTHGNEIERFIAPNGDLSNKMPAYY